MSHNGHGYTDFDYMTLMLDVLLTLINLVVVGGVVDLYRELFPKKRGK